MTQPARPMTAGRLLHLTTVGLLLGGLVVATGSMVPAEMPRRQSHQVLGDLSLLSAGVRDVCRLRPSACPSLGPAASLVSGEATGANHLHRKPLVASAAPSNDLSRTKGVRRLVSIDLRRP